MDKSRQPRKIRGEHTPGDFRVQSLFIVEKRIYCGEKAASVENGTQIRPFKNPVFHICIFSDENLSETLHYQNP
jgi:hypothetical protein